MINLDNLKAGDEIVIRLKDSDIKTLRSCYSTVIIRGEQITSISHPPKLKTKLEELREQAFHNNDYLLKDLLDILIEKESGDE